MKIGCSLAFLPLRVRGVMWSILVRIKKYNIVGKYIFRKANKSTIELFNSFSYTPDCMNSIAVQSYDVNTGSKTLCYKYM